MQPFRLPFKPRESEMIFLSGPALSGSSIDVLEGSKAIVLGSQEGGRG